MYQELVSAGCIKEGNFVLKNGQSSKYYFDIKSIITNPSLLTKIGDELYKKLPPFDIICAIPYGGLPIAVYISTKYNKPMIYIRDKVKDYGTQKLIEGNYKKEDRCVIIDDVLTTGGSLQKCEEIIKDKVTIVDRAVVINRGNNFENVKYLLSKNDIVKHKLKSIKEDKKSNLCFSADLEESEKIIEILEKIGKYIVVCKIHCDIIKDDGTFIEKLIELSIRHNFLIMEDRKFVDISYIVKKQYQPFANWVDLVTVHGSISSETLSNLSGALIVTNMSNNNYDYTERSIQLFKNNQHSVVGFISQYKIEYEDLVTMTPGVSITNKIIDDQKYRSYKDIDSDFIIVGRTIYNASDPEEIVSQLVNN
jgi:uridine monophosphate synthetase